MVTHSKKEVFMTLLALFCHDSAISTPLVRQDRLKFNLQADLRTQALKSARIEGVIRGRL